ncbi:hypothetical protein MMC30_008486 [Trapelia coarctata]|nr:hypothetical protein [Trapelia coarctata]
MTPPPSTQIPKSSYKPLARSLGGANQTRLASPPATLRISPSTNQPFRSGNLPTIEQTQDFSEDQLRNLVGELLPLVGEMRMAAAHAKLQHSLLSIEIVEVAQRAAVEHGMMRRELEVLQASSPLLRNRMMSAASTPHQTHAQVVSEVNAKHMHELEADNLLLHRRLKKAKRLLKQVDGRNVRLEEANELLRQRIRQNRDHVDAMRLNGTISLENTPYTIHNTPSERLRSLQPSSSRAGGQDPFHTLLFAGQVLSGETTSVPSTPTHPRIMRYHHGHARGTHSLSSLPMTPVRSRPMTADEALSTPVNRAIPTSHLSFSAPTSQFVNHQHEVRRTDRDSTISASDQEEAYTDEDIPASQASQVASSMLRHYSGPDPDSSPPQKNIPEPGLVQTKLSGRIIKPGYNTSDLSRKRGFGNDNVEAEHRSKKARMLAKAEQMGLGIAVWPSPNP